MLDDSESISAGETLLGAQQFGLPTWRGGLSRGISRKGQAIRANLGGQHPLEPRESSWNEKQQNNLVTPSIKDNTILIC